jgi:hypothetical protein
MQLKTNSIRKLKRYQRTAFNIVATEVQKYKPEIVWHYAKVKLLNKDIKMQPNSNDTFQAYLMNGFTVFNKQISGTFSINDNNLTMTDDNGAQLFNLVKAQINSLNDA